MSAITVRIEPRDIEGAAFSAGQPGQRAALKWLAMQLAESKPTFAALKLNVTAIRYSPIELPGIPFALNMELVVDNKVSVATLNKKRAEMEVLLRNGYAEQSDGGIHINSLSVTT